MTVWNDRGGFGLIAWQRLRWGRSRTEASSIGIPFALHISPPNNSEWVPGVKQGVKCAVEVKGSPYLIMPWLRMAPLTKCSSTLTSSMGSNFSFFSRAFIVRHWEDGKPALFRKLKLEQENEFCKVQNNSRGSLTLGNCLCRSTLEQRGNKETERSQANCQTFLHSFLYLWGKMKRFWPRDIIHWK